MPVKLGLFQGGLMTCTKCGRKQKSYPNFESQWTSVSVEGGEPIYFCPPCWGIPDPAPLYCVLNGHDPKDGRCQRCGAIDNEPS